MKISFKLDQDEGIDPTDPLGDIKIENDKTLLSVESTYLDSWFDVLIDGYRSLKNRETVTLEIWEEPEKITFESSVQRFKIRDKIISDSLMIGLKSMIGFMPIPMMGFMPINPEPLVMGFKIIYGTKELLLSDLDEFHQSLRASAQDFLSQLEQEGENVSDLPIFIKIRDFIA